MAPGNLRELRPLIRKAKDMQIPVVCVATDAPSTDRLMSVSTDPHTSGSVVAELLTRCLVTPGPVLVVTGDLSVVDHTEKLRGFAERLALMRSSLSTPAMKSGLDRGDVTRGAGWNHTTQKRKEAAVFKEY